MKAMQTNQLELACRAVTKRTTPSRKAWLLRRVERQRDPRWVVIGYYLRLGTVPHALWENWS